MATTPTKLPNGNYTYTDKAGNVTQGTQEAVMAKYNAENPTTTTTDRVSRVQARASDASNTPTSDAPAASGGAGDLATTEADLTKTLADVGAAPSKADILKNKTDEANALIDTIRQQYNETIRSETQAGGVRADRVRALNVSAGLGGSDFATAAAEGDAEKTRQIIASTEAERNAKINAVLSGVPSSADKTFQEATASYRTNAEQGLTAIKSFRDAQRTQADSSIKAIAASGASFDSVKESPGYQKLLDAYGGNESAVKGAFISAIPEPNKLGSTTVGNKYITFFYDPATGKKSNIAFDLPTPLGSEETVQSVFSNGQVAIKSTTYDENGNKHESIRVVKGGGGSDTTDTGTNQTFEQYLTDRESEMKANIDPASPLYRQIEADYAALNHTSVALKNISKTDEKAMGLAGLSKSDAETKAFFLASPAKFRQELQRKAASGQSIGSLKEMTDAYDAFVAESKKTSGGGSSAMTDEEFKAWLTK